MTSKQTLRGYCFVSIFADFQRTSGWARTLKSTQNYDIFPSKI